MVRAAFLIIGLLSLGRIAFDGGSSVVQPGDLQANIRWMKNVNEELDSLSTCYLDEAVKLSPAGVVGVGSQAIADHFRASNLFVRAIKTLAKFTANEQRAIYYEIGAFKTESSDYKHVIIWQGHTGEERRELEFVARADQVDEESVKVEIDQARSRWMQLCNGHNVSDLVHEMYAEHPMYYNHKPLVLTSQDLIEEYSYMGRSEYQLRLSPLKVEVVSNTMVYEIGQCSGSYGGKYVIIWQKEIGGAWKVLLDSNI